MDVINITLVILLIVLLGYMLNIGTKKLREVFGSPPQLTYTSRVPMLNVDGTLYVSDDRYVPNSRVKFSQGIYD